MALEKELETYTKKLPELRQYEGKFVLIHGEDVIDTFDSYEDALKAGFQKFNLEEPFLVKQIHRLEQVLFISRPVTPCKLSVHKT